MLNRELKKGTTPLLILALLEHGPRHGYELSKQIEARSGGVVRIHAASLYPLLYRLEKRGPEPAHTALRPAALRHRLGLVAPAQVRQ
ncbi:MAG: helix-turn-helix transcriptional regulator [Gemmatimonadota bacterium]